MWGAARPSFLLAERARWEGWNDTRADPLLPERARSECARSTAAVGPTRVPFHERRSELAWKDYSPSPNTP